MNQSATCILLFARTSHRESTCKRFAASAKANRQIAAQLLRHTHRTVCRSGLPYVVVTEKQQVGPTFGARISHAVSTVFARGYEHILILGSDCPQLQAKTLTAAAAQLARGRAVSGPATDGGAYLIGLSREQFCPEQFEQLAWETEHLHSELLALLARQSREGVYTFGTLADIDTSATLWQQLPRLLRYIDLRGLRALLTPCEAAFDYQRLRVFSIAYRASAGRAPPVC